MNQGFALYNYIKKEVGNKYISKLCFIIVNDLVTKYNKLVNKRLKKNPTRSDMNLNPSPIDIIIRVNNNNDLEIKIPKYFELYYGFARRVVNNAVSKWFIECKIQGTVIK